MNCLVTGAAGFVGSHLCEKLIEQRFSVVGIDSFENFYPKWIKERNISRLMKEERFELIPKDLNCVDIDSLLEGSDCVFHFAAQAGVRTSWGKNFLIYTKNNIEITQRLLEKARDHVINKFIYASSSSVYGLCPELPMSETSPLFPHSPYGVTKLAAEHLCSLYFKNFGVPTVSLRLFTVYGPRQRPDMAFHKFFKSIGKDEKIIVYGDGKQTRDFTYISDVVDACLSAMHKGRSGEIYNVGGGSQEPLESVFPYFEKICEKELHIEKTQRQKGDVLHTSALMDKAKKDLDYSPKIRIEDGLREEWQWIRDLYSF